MNSLLSVFYATFKLHAVYVICMVCVWSPLCLLFYWSDFYRCRVLLGLDVYCCWSLYQFIWCVHNV